jgi:hypothetical integral membrane protein (TIGR02206 family)
MPVFSINGISHIIVSLVSIALVLIVPRLGKKYPEKALLIGKTIAVILIVSEIIRRLNFYWIGIFDVTRHLPLHLCPISVPFVSYMLWTKSKKIFEITYFWVLIGTLQGIITPDLTIDFPQYEYFGYFIEHSGLVLAVIYAAVVYNFRLTPKSIFVSLFWLNVVFVSLLPINVFLDSNYMWMMGKPPINSLFDIMGPWPWYIITCEFIAIGFGYFFLIPIRQK